MHGNYTVVGDLHLTPKSMDKAAQLFEKVEALGLPVIWLGDLLDTKEVIRGKCLNVLFDYLSKSKLNHLLLVGNHDWFNLECKDHSLKPLSTLPNVKIVDYLDVRSPKVTMLPYYHDKTYIKQLLKEIPDGNVVIGHFDISGFDYGNGHFCEDGLTLEDFSRFKRVISGHFHKHQVKDNLIYLGTPYSHSFGESDQDKFIMVYDFDNDVPGFIPSGFPKHVTLKLDLLEDGAKGKLDSFLEDHSNDIIRVQLYGSPEVCAKFNDKYRPLYDQKYNVKFEDKSEGRQLEGNIDETLDNKTQFVTWAAEIKKMDPETIKLGLSVLEALGAK